MTSEKQCGLIIAHLNNYFLIEIRGRQGDRYAVLHIMTGG
jgi:hypothetical protein